MSQERTLVKNTFVLGFGKIATQAATFILLPVYTFFLSPIDFGIVDLMTTYVALLAPLLILQLDRAVFRELIEARGNFRKSREVISSTVAVIAPLVSTALAVYIVICLLVVIPHALLIAGLVLATIASNLVLQFARGLGRNDIFAITSVVLGVSNLIAVAGLLAILHAGVAGVLIGLIIANSSAALFAFIKLKLYKYITFSRLVVSRNEQVRLIKFAWPLVPSAISWWFIKTFDRTLVTMIVGLTANGIYAAANKYSLIFTSLYSIFDMSWTEAASARINSKDRDAFFSSVYNKSFKFFASIAVGLIAITPFVFSMVVGSQFGEARLYIPVLIIGAFLNALVSQYSVVYIAKKMTVAVLVTSIVSAVISVACNLVLINTVGVMGAALSLVATFLVMAIWRHYDIKKYVTITFERLLFVKLALLFTVVTCIYYINHPIMNVVGFVFVTCFTLWFSRETVFPIFASMRAKIKK